jgi:hypothetical protein
MADARDLCTLVYLSSAVTAFSTQDLRELLTKSRVNNSSLDVTGMLLFKDGNFLQVLEGEQANVRGLYQRIAKDKRHGGCTILFQSVAEERSFPDWSMGFHDLNSADVREIPGFSPFLGTSLTVADFGKDPGRAKKLLLLFKDEKLFGSPECLIQASK